VPVGITELDVSCWSDSVQSYAIETDAEGDSDPEVSEKPIVHNYTSSAERGIAAAITSASSSEAEEAKKDLETNA
jgi:hypothetical protein